MRTIKLFMYCLVMRIIWRLSYRLFNWAEDSRPAGGFHPKNIILDQLKEVADRMNYVTPFTWAEFDGLHRAVFTKKLRDSPHMAQAKPVGFPPAVNTTGVTDDVE